MMADMADVLAWRDELGVLEARLGQLFVRPEPRRQASLYLEGLLSAAKRKNGWQLETSNYPILRRCRSSAVMDRRAGPCRRRGSMLDGGPSGAAAASATAS